MDNFKEKNPELAYFSQSGTMYEREYGMYIAGLNKYLTPEVILESDDLTVVLKAHLFLEILPRSSNIFIP